VVSVGEVNGGLKRVSWWWSRSQLPA
jgi:hypothetical protein